MLDMKLSWLQALKKPLMLLNQYHARIQNVNKFISFSPFFVSLLF